MYVLCGYICCKENCPSFFPVRKYEEVQEEGEQDHAEKGEADTSIAYGTNVWQREEQRESGKAGRGAGKGGQIPFLACE